MRPSFTPRRFGRRIFTPPVRVGIQVIVDHRNVPAALWRLGAPNALALVADQFLGIADTIVVGALGTAALAGISAATSIFVIIAIGLWAFPSAGRIMEAQALGRGDVAAFGRIVRSSLVTPVLIAVLVAVASVFAAEPTMRLMLGSIPIRSAASHYLVLRCISLIPIAISAQAIAAFGAAGNARLAPRTLFIINVVHIPMLIVLALGVGTHVRLGLFGAGLSSLLSECVGAIYCVIVTMRRPQYHILEELDIDFGLARATTLLALPEFVMLVLLLVPDALTVAFLAPLGAVAVAAFRAFTVVTDLTWAVPGAFGDSMQIVIGQRLGAGDAQGAQDFLRHATRLAVMVGTIVGVIFMLLSWPLTALVTLSPMLANVAALPLALHLATLPIKSYAIAVLAPIRAAGDTRFSMWAGITGALVAVSLIAFLTHVVQFGLYAIGIAWMASWSVRSFMTWLRLRRGDWTTRRIPALAGVSQAS
ncbi:MAG TPA: MATE family efflux transporter [Candidatus Acidoferrales bacterium]|nr:MATE family efflux transporter [Candidatus Acidoferrales bacterium]